MKALDNLLEEKKLEILNTGQKKLLLIQKLTSVFNQLTNHEKSVIDKVSSNFNNLMAVASAYPNLMTNNIFLENYNQVEKLENELQQKMAEYNFNVTKYNNKVSQFPDFILAWIFRFKRKKYAELK